MASSAELPMSRHAGDRTAGAGGGLLEGLYRFERGAFAFERWVCCLSLLVMLLAVAGSVLVRNLNLPTMNPGEFGVVAMSSLTFVGAAMCTYLGSHIAVDVVSLSTSGGLRRAGRVVVAMAMVAFALIYGITGWTYLVEAWGFGEKLLDTGTPLVVPLAFLPLGMALVLLHALCEVTRVISGRETPSLPEADEAGPAQEGDAR